MPVMSEEDHARITAAVAEAELHTSGEIVTVLADRSDGYTDIALVWSVIGAFAALTVLALAPALVLALAGSLRGAWGVQWSPGELIGLAAAVGIIAFFVCLLPQLFDTVRFALVPGIVKTTRVEDRAIDLFKVGAERRTHGRTGVLIYLSMREHRAEIVADEAITAQVAPEAWGEAMAEMLVDIRDGRIADGLIAGVRNVGAVLAQHFPRADDDINELPDLLIEL